MSDLYRKKPVVIEARQFTPQNILDLRDWITSGGHGAYPGWNRSVGDYIEIDTLEGVMRATIGDWIIRGVQGEFYPCKPDIFEQTYEPVEGGEE